MVSAKHDDLGALAVSMCHSVACIIWKYSMPEYNIVLRTSVLDVISVQQCSHHLLNLETFVCMHYDFIHMILNRDLTLM
jgi:hypothetical protein